MAVTVYQIKRWYLMLTGKSVWHVNQNRGQCFSKTEVKGYYNDLQEKVTMLPELLESDELPKLYLEDGSFTYFPVAIFQYGLGAYDLFLKTEDNKYAKKFMQCANWALDKQDKLGRWNNFSHYSPEHPYGAMAQGEGASLLVRAYLQSKDKRYLEAARKAIDFMLVPLEEGGTAKYVGNDVFLMEYTFKPMVLNGSIFAWWGLYDYVLATSVEGKYKEMLDGTLDTLVKVLPAFDNSFWSLYTMDGLITSPFYHNLHIAQMEVMYELTNLVIFDKYARKWYKEQHNCICKSLAFVKKAFQKIIEKNNI